MGSASTDVRSYYESRESHFRKEALRLESSIKRSSLLRLILFVILLAALYFFWGRLYILIPTLITGVALYTLLVIRHEKLKKQSDLSNEMLRINKRELQVLSRDFSGLSRGDQYRDDSHYYSHDIDLFGTGSLFQYVSRTSTSSGSDLLARWMKANDCKEIGSKQEMIDELGSKANWRQEFEAKANLIDNRESHEQILGWFDSYLPFVPRHMKYIPGLFGLVSFALVIGVAVQLVSFHLLTLWFFLGLGLSFFYFKRVNQLYEKASEAKNTFSQYQNLLSMIESETFSSALLSSKKKGIESDHVPASELFRDFSQILHAFDHRNNMLFGVLGNGLLLWDLKQCYRIETWIFKNKDLASRSFDAIAHFDACSSLSNYRFNHPQQVFPEITLENGIIRAESLGHPLIDPKTRVDNDFSIEQGEFVIVTGANMAGKSTFLRALSLSIVMANMGLPVCARSYRYSPIKLITSMRTADSLAEESSYFYAEIKRLEFIVQKIENEKYFIVLDEILKGTNSKDKAEGSRRFLKKLVNSGSSGLIATHDLSLCEIEKEHPHQIHNMHFDVEIRGNDLEFDYLLKPGICNNMNASFLLRKMNLI